MMLQVKGAAYRNIILTSRCAAPLHLMSPIFATNIAVRCTFTRDVADFCYKYCGALHLYT